MLIEQYQWEGIAVGVLLLSGYLFMRGLVPAGEQVFALKSHLNEQHEKIALAENWEDKLAEYSKQEERLRSFFSTHYVSLTQNDQMSAIVEMVFEHARKSGVTVHQMRPLQEAEYDTYTIIPVVLKAEGEFHNVVAFIYNLEHAQQLIKLTGLTLISPREEAGGSTLAVDLEIDVMAIYRGINQGEKDDD